MLSGYQQCPSAGECIAYCIGEHAGAVVRYEAIMEARIRNTRLSVENPAEFFALLYADLRRARDVCYTEKRFLACRLNTFSDRAWEVERPEIFTDFYDVQFYDYTKIRGRVDRFLAGKFPPNYHLTYSLSERTPTGYAGRVLDQGGTVAVAIDISIRSSRALPKEYIVDGKSYPTIDGDVTDLRFLDKLGCVILLRAKGNALTKQNRFIKPAE